MANLKIKLAIAVISFTLLGAKFHPYYISVTEIKHNAKEQTLEISCKLFADDIEKDLKFISGSAVNLLAAQDSAKNQALLTKYFLKKLKLTADGKDLKIDFLGFEKEQGAIWCYMQVSSVKDFHKLCVETTVLYDFTPDQINIIHIIKNSNRKSDKLNNPESKMCVEF